MEKRGQQNVRAGGLSHPFGQGDFRSPIRRVYIEPRGYNQYFTKGFRSGDFSRFLAERLTRSGYYVFVIY